MFNWTEIEAKQEQFKDLLRQAEKERLVQGVVDKKQFIRLSQTINWLWAMLLLRTG